MIIPCETIVRFSKIVMRAQEPAFQVLRLQDGMMIASDRRLLAVEKLTTSFAGTHHIRLPESLVNQCIEEQQYGGVIDVIPNDMLKFTMVKSSYGWSSPENLGVWFDGASDLDRWQEILNQCSTPLQAPGVGGTMVWSAKDVATLAASSPSGEIAFERIIDPDARPTLMCDIATDAWVGCWLPRIPDGVFYPPASLPTWAKVRA